MHHPVQPLHLTRSSFKLQLIGLFTAASIFSCKSMCDEASAGAVSALDVELLLCAPGRLRNTFAAFDLPVSLTSKGDKSPQVKGAEIFVLLSEILLRARDTSQCLCPGHNVSRLDTLFLLIAPICVNFRSRKLSVQV
jgi:hypothetical protein